MAEIILFPSIMKRYARSIVLCKSKNEISKIIDSIETLFDLGIFDPPEQFWPWLTKLVEKKVARIKKEKTCA